MADMRIWEMWDVPEQTRIGTLERYLTDTFDALSLFEIYSRINEEYSDFQWTYTFTLGELMEYQKPDVVLSIINQLINEGHEYFDEDDELAENDYQEIEFADDEWKCAAAIDHADELADWIICEYESRPEDTRKLLSGYLSDDVFMLLDHWTGIDKEEDPYMEHMKELRQDFIQAH